ncbi:MAG: ABC transporter substrate-binding protein [Acidimicrobiales bacterium]
MRSRNWRFAAAGACLASLLLAACGSSPSSSPTGTSASTGSKSSTGTSGASGAGAFQAAHAGGTLHLQWSSGAGTLDPQVNYTLEYWQLYQAVYDGLVAFAKTTGQESFTVVPDLATAMPTVTNSGKTYTFTLRKGIKFSNGAPLTLTDVVDSFTRLFKVTNPNAGTWYNVIVGGNACLKTPATCTLKGGVVTNPATNQVTFNLTQADPDFLDQLAVPFGSILPSTAPIKAGGTNTPIPSTGPYYFSSYNPTTQLVMKRNPYFKVWSALAEPAGYPNEIVTTFGATVENEVTAIENGQADWMGDPPPPDRLAEMSTKYASQVHVNTLTADWYVVFNTRLAPFNNLLARQAFNWAVNRAAAVKLYGGSELAVPACTILPPGFPGYTPFCYYTKPAGSLWQGPDLALAKQLVQRSGTAGMKVALVAQNDTVDYNEGQYLVSVLNQIGYKATLKPLSPNIQFTYIQNTNNHVQISLSQWYQDYPQASDFLQVLLGCANFHPGSDSSINIAGYCNPSLDAQMARATVLQSSNLTAANKLWGQIDQEMMKQAVWAPLFHPKLIDFVSARVRHYEFSRQYYMLVDQLWLK